jgi:hypothetical protein
MLVKPQIPKLMPPSPFPRIKLLPPGVARRALLGFLIGLSLAAMGPVGRAEALRSQVIPLRTGWNAVFLEVDPLDARPEQVLAGAPVEMVAMFHPEVKPVLYPRNPAEHRWQEEGWDVWYAATRPEAFLSNLSFMRGQRAYLIRVSENYSWTIRGKVIQRPIQWAADAFTLTGFAVDPADPPTFGSYFAGGRSHAGQQMFRLENGIWVLVRDPGHTKLGSGEAYWIFSKGASRFQGPLRAKPPMGDGLAFGARANDLQLEFANDGTAPLDLWVESVPGEEPLPLSYEFRDRKNLFTTYPVLPSVLVLPDLQPSSKTTLRLSVRREDMTRPSQSGLLKVHNGNGVVLWIPVEASKH